METPLWFDVSLAQWSLHRAFEAGSIDPLDFARTAREDYGIEGVEYVSKFYATNVKTAKYVQQMKQRAADHEVRSLLIMIDNEGNLGDADPAARAKTIDNHKVWVDAAHELGCHSIRVNAAGEGSREKVAAAATEGLYRLSEYAAQASLNVIVENHGGYSSDGKWLSSVIAAVKLKNCGTLPDFGNFCIEKSADRCVEEYDRYQGVHELMPYAKAVSAKTYDFDDNGLETEIDYKKMLGIVKEAGYSQWVGIEYEGEKMSEPEGIRATLALLNSEGKKV